MVSSRLISVLRTFSKKEIRDFRKWLLSPFHNQREDVVRLYDYLLDDNHLNNNEVLSKEGVFRWIFSKETYDDAKMRQVMHFLLKGVENFLTYKELIENEDYTKIALAKVYRKRNLDKSFIRTVKEIKSIQKKSPLANGVFLYNDYLIQEEEYEYSVRKKKGAVLNLQELSDKLDIAYAADKLRHSCNILANQTLYKKNYEIGLIEEVLTNVETKGYLSIPVVAIYYYGYKTIIKQDDESNFQNLKKEILKNGQIFPKGELQAIYLMAINYSIRQMNTGNKAFRRETFELFKHGIEQHILIDDGILSSRTFLNVVVTGALLKEYNWIDLFIYNYQEYLELEHRENTVNFCRAKLYYETGDYNKAMPLLGQYEYDHPVMNLNAKVMLLKMYYEEEELDALESLMDSMKIYLHRKKVIGYHKSLFKNIIKMMKKLLKLTTSESKQKLKAEIESTNPLTERTWLLAQLEKL